MNPLIAAIISILLLLTLVVLLRNEFGAPPRHEEAGKVEEQSSEKITPESIEFPSPASSNNE